MILCAFYGTGSLIYLEIEMRKRNKTLAKDFQTHAEQERKRISRDLHDSVLQSLSGVIRSVDKLGKNIPDKEEPGQIRLQLEECIAEIREVMHALHPVGLEEFGLIPSLQQLLKEWESSTGIKTQFEENLGSTRLSPECELAIYRIVQEGLNNVQKHAEAKQTKLRIHMLGKNLTLTISDDGKGGVKEKSDSFGIRNIRDRARILNGKAEWKKPLEFETGTMLSLQIPIASLQEKPVISQAK